MEDGGHVDVEIDVILVMVEEGMECGGGFVSEEGGSEYGGGGSSRCSDMHGPPIYFR